MGEVPVAALARGRELSVHLAPLGLDLALALAHLPAFPTFLDAPPFIIVLRVVGPALPIQVPLQAAEVVPVGCHVRAEGLEQRLLLGDHGDGAWPQVQADDALAQPMLGLAVGHAFTDQLSVEAVAFAQLAAHQAYILHGAGQPVCLRQIVLLEQTGQHQTQPLDPVLAPAEALSGHFAFHAVELGFAPRAARASHARAGADWRHHRRVWRVSG